MTDADEKISKIPDKIMNELTKNGKKIDANNNGHNSDFVYGVKDMKNDYVTHDQLDSSIKLTEVHSDVNNSEINGKLKNLETKIDGNQKNIEIKMDGNQKIIEAKIDGIQKSIETKIENQNKLLWWIMGIISASVVIPVITWIVTSNLTR